MGIKVYLDDLRACPHGWVLAQTYEEVIDLLSTGTVDELSLDHDLSFDHYAGDYSKSKTGYDVALWLEEQLFLNNRVDLIPKKLKVHSANPAGSRRIEQVLNKISLELKNRGVI